MKILKIAFLTLVCLSLVPGLQAESPKTRIAPDEAKRIIEKRAQEAINVLKNRDIPHLARLVHPDKGLFFSAYPNKGDPEYIFPKNEVRELSFKDKDPFLTASPGGSGDDVTYTFAQYYEKFVYHRDFAKAPHISYNEHLSEGNCGITLYEDFPGSIVVEYYFPGFDPKREGSDWESLFLTFEKAADGKWYLVDIAHDQWCI